MSNTLGDAVVGVVGLLLWSLLNAIGDGGLHGLWEWAKTVAKITFALAGLAFTLILWLGALAAAIYFLERV